MKLQVVQVQGSSMRPFIRAGDYVVIEPGALTKAHLGDVVAVTLYGERDRLRVHRLWWKNLNKRGTTVFIKGDAISSLDKVRTGIDGEYLGKVVSIIRPAGEKRIPIENGWINLIKLVFSVSLIPWQIIRGH